MLEPSRLRQEGSAEYTLLGIIDRTLSIYHNIHTAPIIQAWFRINREVSEYDARLYGFIEWVKSQGWKDEIVHSLCHEVNTRMARLGESTSRIDIPLHIVEPSTPLGETLDFAPATIESNIKDGYQDMLKVLQSADKIDYAELARLQNAPIFAEG
jgi:hypothetical protein